MRSIFAFAAAALAAVTSAYTQPVGPTPSGNPIYKPGLNEIVPAGKPYTITWDPTTPGTVTLVLLRGPSNNVKPMYPIIEKIPNSGTYVWTPSTALKPDTTHYGIQLIVDSNGQYQYTTQFGISNPSYNGGASSSAASSVASYAASSAASSAASYAASSAASSATSNGAYVTSSTSCTTSSTITPLGYNSTITAYPTSYGTGASSYLPHNSTIVKPTKSMTVPSSLKTTTKQPTGYTTNAPVTSAPVATTSGPAQATGAAGKLSVGLGAIMGAIVLAL